jgi:hypothetical protein
MSLATEVLQPCNRCLDNHDWDPVPWASGNSSWAVTVTVLTLPDCPVGSPVLGEPLSPLWVVLLLTPMVLLFCPACWAGSGQCPTLRNQGSAEDRVPLKLWRGVCFVLECF